MVWALTERRLPKANGPRARWSAPLASRWYVSNGQTVVGPVDTDLLLRGITSARIPGDSMVLQESWACWRDISQTREHSRLQRSFSWAAGPRASAEVPDELVRRARDAGEALLLAMHAAVVATRAAAGLTACAPLSLGSSPRRGIGAAWTDKPAPSSRASTQRS